MVSLNTQHNTQRGGGMSFDDRLLHINDENTPLIINTEQSYKPIRTTIFIIIHILFMIIFENLIIFVPYLCYDKQITKLCDHYSAYNISLYIHASSFFISMIFDRLYHYYQHLSRRNGYLNFYRQTKTIRRMPLIIISIGNSILIIMIKLLENYQSSILPLQPWHCLVILTSIEVIIILIVLIYYLIRTIQFNKQCARPDAVQDDFLSMFVTSQTNANEIGFRDETYTENILEKQGDLIRYLRERNDHLSRLVHHQSQPI